MDFIKVVDAIFKNKHDYHKINDEDKINSFYIINKKFYINNPAVSNFFNHIHIDKASAMDMWYLIFRHTYKIPDWYWTTNRKKNNNDNSKKYNPTITTKNTLDKQDKELIMRYYDISEEDVDFLYKHYTNELKDKIALLKKGNTPQHKV